MTAKTDRVAKADASTTPAQVADRRRNAAGRLDMSGFANLQPAAGNFAIQRMLRSGAIQAKLTIGQPHDVYEQEADGIADRIVPSAPTPMVQPKRTAGVEGTRGREAPHEPPARTDDAAGQDPRPSAVTELSLTQLQSGGRPLPPDVRAQFEPWFGRAFADVRLHTEASDAARARSISARAFTSGSHIYFGAGEYQPSTGSGQHLLAHELTHVAQQAGSGAGHREPKGPSLRADRTSLAIRRQGDPNAADANAAHADAAAPPEPVQAGPPSFDPLAVDVAGMSNETLNAESVRVEDWFAAHAAGDPDHAAYDTLRGRLRVERTSRVQLGHAWMSQPSRTAPTRLYMIASGAGGRLEIISVDLARALGVPNETPAGPIMTEMQYRAYLAAHGIREVDQQTYERSRAARGSGGDQDQRQDAANPSATAQPGQGQPPSTPLFAMYVPPQAPVQQPGGIVIHHGTTQSGYQGFAGGIDLNAAGGAHQDFSRGLYTSTDVEVALHGAAARASQRGEGGMQYVLQWELDPRLVNIVDIRPGGAQRALWEQFLQETPAFAGPGSSVAGQSGFRTHQEYLEHAGVEQRGFYFEQFLRRNGLQNADVIMGDLGGAATGGKLALPDRVSDQVVIRSQRAVDILNAQMRGEPPPGGANPAGGEPTRPGGGTGGVAFGAAAGGIIAVLTAAGWMYFDAAEHPDWAAQLVASGGQGTLTGATQVAVERAILSGASRVAPGAASEALASFARGGAAGVVSAGLEIYNITQEPYQHSDAEVGVRVTRAAGIGVVSAEVGTAASAGLLAVMFGAAAEGAAVGTVVPGWGTAIGFVAGLVVGGITYYALDQTVPGGREDWHPSGPPAARPARDPDEPPAWHCFTADTQVALADGTSRRISTLTPGDRVLAVPDAAVAGSQPRACAVERILVHPPTDYLLMDLDDGTALKVTHNHPLFADHEWREAAKLRAGDFVVALDANRRGLRRVQIDRIEQRQAQLPVYDLVVADCHTFFAGGVLAHNKEF